MHLQAHKLSDAHELCTRAEPCDWSAGAHGVTSMLGVSLRARSDTTLVFLIELYYVSNRGQFIVMKVWQRTKHGTEIFF